MTRPVLHDYWRSSASYRVRIALNLKGIEYDSQQVNLLTGEHRSEVHRARNPQGYSSVDCHDKVSASAAEGAV